ncbi:MAG: nicotinate phosphoribosyltransferase [Anaerorhabdus sp.]
MNINKELMLMTDFYEYTMAYAYFKENKHNEIAYFDMFTRKIPDGGGFMIFNGLHRFMEFVNNFQYDDECIDYLRKTQHFDEDFLAYLKDLRLDIDIWACPEGTVVFANEPLVTIKGNLIQAQIVETMLLLCINYATLITTKSVRINNAAQGRGVIEMGSRRAHEFTAALEGARAAYIGGCTSSACTAAGEKYGVPITGTTAHSYIQLHDNELEAFKSYARVSPDSCIFLVDTYDTIHSGIPNAIQAAKEELLPRGYRLKGVRIDSGDLAYLAKKARKLLDDADMADCKIIASNSLDEEIIEDLIKQEAPIDIFGVGENLITAKSTPVLGGVYKVVACEKVGVITPKIKMSENVEKLTNPGFKKVVRFYDNKTNKAIGDVLMLYDEPIPTEEYVLFDPVAPWKQKRIVDYTARILQLPIFENGKCVYDMPTTQEVRKNCEKEMASLWDEVKRQHYPHRYYVDYSKKLFDLKNELIKKNTVKI